MVAPITGPFVTDDFILFPPPYGGFDRWSRHRSTYRQQKPFDVPLAYDTRQGFMSIRKQGDADPWQSASGLALTTASTAAGLSEAKSKAWAQFVSSIGENAQLGASLAEGRQAMGMMAQRALQLARFLKHLNRFEFEKARHDLELPRKKSTDVWSRDRTVANNFLEVHFGWSPLVSDIHSALSVFSSPVKPHLVKGRGASGLVESRDNYPPPLNSWSTGNFWKFQAKVQYLAWLEVSNPNIALANQLGLLNPAAVLWELVPYSFVVDWFVNVGQSLSCMSDLFGYSVTNPMTTTYKTSLYWGTYASTNQTLLEGQAFAINRSKGFQYPTPFVRPFKGLSLARGITAMALLVQKLPRRPADMATPSLRERRVYRWTDFAANTSQVPYVRKKPPWVLP